MKHINTFKIFEKTIEEELQREVQQKRSHENIKNTIDFIEFKNLVVLNFKYMSYEFSDEFINDIISREDFNEDIQIAFDNKRSPNDTSSDLYEKYIVEHFELMKNTEQYNL